MEADKIKMVRAFNVEAFLNWQGQFYDLLPDWVEDEKNALEERVLQDWQAFADAVKENRQPQAETKHVLSQEAQQLENEYRERRQTVELLERLETPILGASYFFGLQTGTIGGIQIEIERIQKRIATGITTPEQIMEKRVAESLEFIDLPLLEWMTTEHPILESHGLAALQTLIEIGVCQWILEQQTEIQADGKARPKPKKWSLTFKICLLKEIGFFELEKIKRIHHDYPGKRNELVSLLLSEDATNTKKAINKIRKPDEIKKDKNLEAASEKANAYLNDTLPKE